MRRPGRLRRGPWEEYALAVLLEKGIEAVVEIGTARIAAQLEEWRRHESGEAEREFEARFDAALAGEPEIEEEEDELEDPEEELELEEELEDDAPEEDA